MHRLLVECRRPGYPAEYLLSRIRARMDKQGHVSPFPDPPQHGSELEAEDARIWSEAAAQRRWLYLQMEYPLRRVLAPLLLYFEVDTLVICLRQLETGRRGTALDMEKSLLAEGLREIVQTSAAPSEAVAKIERFMKNSSLPLGGLSEAYDAGGVQGCEELIRSAFLGRVISVCGHPSASFFFRSIVDLHNVISMAKCLRWKKQDVPALFDGGRVRIRKADKSASATGVGSMVRRLTGGMKVAGEELHPVTLEPKLREHLVAVLKRQMRGGDPVVNCIAYVWHISTVSRKRSGTYHANRFADNFAGSPEAWQ